MISERTCEYLSTLILCKTSLLLFDKGTTTMEYLRSIYGVSMEYLYIKHTIYTLYIRCMYAINMNNQGLLRGLFIQSVSSFINCFFQAFFVENNFIQYTFIVTSDDLCG